MKSTTRTPPSWSHGAIVGVSAMVALIVSGVSSAGPIEDLQPGNWYEVPNSKLRGVAYPWSSVPTKNAVGVAGVIDVWSGGAYDNKRDRLIVWGGGHYAYGGNEIYAFDIAQLRWVRVNDPSNPVAEDTAYAPDGGPCARHTYDYIQYVASIDRFCTFGGAGFYSSGQTGTSNLDCFNFDTGAWEKKGTAPSTGIGTYSAYDAVTGHTFVYGSESNCRLTEWNPSANSWTVRSNQSGCYDYYKTAAIDTKRRLMVAIGGGGGHVWRIGDSGTLTRETLSATGATEILNAGNPGFDYDPVSDRFVAWNGGSNVYLLNMDTRAITRVSPAGTNTVTPTSANGNGTYGRFRYIPSKNAFVVVNSVDQNVYIYKLSSGAGSGSVPTTPGAPTTTKR